MSTMKHRALLLCAGTVLVATSGQAQVSRSQRPRGTLCTYIGPDGGYWNDPANWDMGVPNGYFDAFINGTDTDVNVLLDLNPMLTNLTITAGDSVTMLNNRFLRMYTDGGASTISNAGTIYISSTGSSTEIYCQAQTDGDVITLSGGGEIVADSGGPCYLEEYYSNAVLRNLDNTFRGLNLDLGRGSLEIINEGLIWSDSGGTITVDPPNGYWFGMTNTGTLRADGGTLRLNGGHYANDGGVIEALNGSAVHLYGDAAIHGGTLRGTGGGEIQVVSGHALFDLRTGFTPTVAGTFRLLNNASLRVQGAGTINNGGTIYVSSTGSSTEIYCQVDTAGDVITLSGGGEIVADSGGPCEVTEYYSNPILHNLDNTFRGANLNLGTGGLEIINEGLVLADSDVGQIIIDPPGDGYGFDNRGTLQATGAAGMQIRSGLFTTSGTVEIAAGSSLSRTGNFVQTDGATTVDGTLSVTSGSLLLQGGTLTGEGTITGDVSNSAGDIEPGGGIATLSLTGDFAQSDTGTLLIELGGFSDGEYDVLEITGNAALGGYLDLQPVNGFVPAIGDSFTILTATGTISGWLRLPDCGGMYEIEYAPNAVIAHVTGTVYPGDFNCDGCVDQSDLGILLAAFNNDDGGDINGDGDTDQADLGELLSHYGDGC